MSWESISLSDALRPLKSSPFTRDELSFSGGQYQNVLYVDILVRFPSVVDAEKEGLPYVNDSSEGRCTRCTLLQNGDIIIADTAEDEAVGKAIEIQGIKDQKVVSGLHTMAFRPQEGLFAPGFLGYFLNSSVYHNQLLPLMQGIKVLSISKTAIGDTVIKYPSYKEQERIVDSFSGIDDMIRALDDAIAKKRQIKEGLMQQLLTGKTRLPGFCGEWRECCFDDIFNTISDRGKNIDTSEYKESGSYPVIDQGQEIVAGYTNRVNPIVPSSQGCIVFGDHTRVFKFIDYPFFTGADGTQLLVVKSAFNSKYIYYQCCRLDIPNTGYNRHFKFLKEKIIMVPSEKEEQNAIAALLSTADLEIERLILQRNKYALIKQGMIHNLLTGITRL